MMRILIVDDHPLFREALGSLLEDFYSGSSVFEVCSLEEAIGVLNQYAGFDLIVLDIPLSGEVGIAGLDLIQEKAQRTPIVIMSGADDAVVAHHLIEHGVRGYIAKSAGRGDVKNALRLILAGEIYISPSVLAETGCPTVRANGVPVAVIRNDSTPDISGLTPRQQDVFRLMARGLPNKSIARELNCSDGTVKLHVSAILRTLHARNRTEAVQAASRLGAA